MKFKEWLKLQEVGTSTADVASFKLPALGAPITRQWPWNVEDPFFKKKKKKSKETPI